MIKSKKRCSEPLLQCDSCFLKSVFDSASPFVTSPIKGICENLGPNENVFEVSKLQMFLSFVTAALITVGFGSYLPLIWTSRGRNSKECLQLIAELFCCFLGLVATYTNVLFPHVRINNMRAWHRLVKKCKFRGYYNLTTTFRRSTKRKNVLFMLISVLLPATMISVRLTLLETKSYWFLRMFGVPLSAHLQLMIILRHVLVMQFLKELYTSVHNKTIKYLLRDSQLSLFNRNKYSTELAELNRIYIALYYNCNDFAEHISTKFALWFGAVLATLIINIYSIVLLSNAQIIVIEIVTLKCQTIVLIVIIIYLLNQIQRLYDVVSINRIFISGVVLR